MMPLIAVKSLPAAADIAPLYDDGEMKITHWLSAPTIDSDGEAIDGDAFDLAIHKSHPVLLVEHRRRDLPIGHYRDRNGRYTLESKAFPGGGKGLYGTAWFSKANPAGAITYGLYREGILSGFSAGFVAGARRVEKAANGRTYRRYTSAVLIEGSATGTPANLDALATIVHKRRFAEESVPDDLLEYLRRKLAAKNLAESRCILVPVTRKSHRSSELPPLGQTMNSDTPAEPAPETQPDPNGLEEIRKTYGTDIAGYPGDGVVCEALRITKAMFQKDADVLGCWNLLQSLLTTHKMIQETDATAGGAVFKTLTEMAGRVDELSALPGTIKELTDGVAAKFTELETKSAALEANIAALAKRHDDDTTALSDNLAALAGAAGLMKA